MPSHVRLSARPTAGLAAYLVLATTATLGTVVAGSGQAVAAGTATGGKQTAQHGTPATSGSKAATSTAAKTQSKAAAKPASKAAAKPAAKPAAKAATTTAAKTVSYPDTLDGWIAEARAVLAANGDHVPSAESIKARAMTESSGNPDAENHWDSNESLYGGTYGLLQTIKPTFAQWALPGHTDIMDPVDSIISGVRYANDRYGSFETIAYTKAGY
ncbi:MULTISPECIES: transglycosylase SLT domain-containing protein [Streptacidiphilus]|uniref:Transglycosylase SLT domain-containing protein n=1 Tax=Streptacidiphilus cavernicola TaxID=3342716 RepID=A0ABV6UPR1_9ACTN|nr:transglycosylase SLT domain-containing protein [Streptacidiphilus jeojiense]